MSVGFLTKGTSMDHQNSMPPRMSPPKFIPPPGRETTMRGRREHTLTIVTFDLQSSSGEHDTLTIDIDDRREKSPSRVTIRGKWEAAEIPSQLRWLADAIAQHGEDKNPATREHVTYEKLRGGGA
jgi:hypothetical protein